MLKPRLLILSMILLACPGIADAQITSNDVLFLRLSARTRQMAYEQKGGDMKEIAPLIAQADRSAAGEVGAYRAYTHAIALMSGVKWTPDAELATALDFSVNAKVVGSGEMLRTNALFLFNAPVAENHPYRIEIDILARDGAKEAALDSGISLGDVRGRRAGDMIGIAFDPSKLVGPGLHTLRATLKDSRGNSIYQYYRTFFVIKDLGKRLTALEKNVELLADQKSLASTTARYVLEAVRQAYYTYLGGPYQNLLGYIHASFRATGLSYAEVMDFDAELDRATKLAAALKEGKSPLDGIKGDLRLAYRSSFDGRLVAYRLYVPSSYDPSKEYPLIMALHGAGGNENTFFDRYNGQWVKLAEERGYILVAASGRGPVSGYAKENGAEQDVLDVIGLVEKNYRVDPARVYLAGHSMGASGTWRIGLEYRDRFAALAPIAGTRPGAALDQALSSGRKLPIIIVAGAKDALVPVAGCREVAEKAKTLGHRVKYLEYGEGDHFSVAVASVKDIFDWFDAHRKQTP